MAVAEAAKFPRVPVRVINLRQLSVMCVTSQHAPPQARIHTTAGVIQIQGAENQRASQQPRMTAPQPSLVNTSHSVPKTAKGKGKGKQGLSDNSSSVVSVSTASTSSATRPPATLLGASSLNSREEQLEQKMQEMSNDVGALKSAQVETKNELANISNGT